MRRFFVLFLILLLPLQVFAGIAGDRLLHSQQMQKSHAFTVLQYQSMTSMTFQADDHRGGHDMQQDIDMAAGAASDPEDTSGDELADDFANHAGLGDDAVLSAFPIFAMISPPFISSLHNDAASIPPYLPPAARPPKI
jgi:hypothetical protein